MCFSSNAIEQETIKVTEQIKKKTIYKFVKADFINGHDHEDDLNLISRITLEDHSGKSTALNQTRMDYDLQKGPSHFMSTRS